MIHKLYKEETHLKKKYIYRGKKKRQEEKSTHEREKTGKVDKE